MATLGAPKAVSPLIKFCRWGALTVGIVYGARRMSSLTKKEVKIQEVDNKIRAQRDARIAQEKEVAMKLEMEALGREAGVLK